MRLAGGFTPSEGRLELLGPNGQWAQVFGMFGKGAARVACRQLGLGGGALRRYFYDAAGGPPGSFGSLE